jgi:hypothetical protein
VPTRRAGSPHASVPAGSLDTGDAPLAAIHVHAASKAPWDELNDDCPQFAHAAPPALLKELAG